MSRADDLYGLPLDEFTAARDALAKELRTDGDRDAAAAVKKLRKPNLAAWALNQLARRHGAQIDALLESGQRLRAAQRKVMSGGNADDLREATEERRHLVGALVKQAEEILTGSGHAASTATMSGVHDSLMAVATDPDAADRLQRGVLERELHPGEIPEIAGFTVIEGGKAQTTKPEPWREPAAVASEPRTEDAASEQQTEAGDSAAEARVIRDRIAARVAELEAEAAEADRVAEAAADEAERANLDASSASRDADEAAAAAEDARLRAEKARQRADDARREADDRTEEANAARAAAERARDDMDAARRSLDQAESLLKSLEE